MLGRCAPYTVTHEAATDWTCERHALTVHVLCITVYENMLDICMKYVRYYMEVTACHYLLFLAKSMGLYGNDTELVCGCVVVRRYKRDCCAVVLAHASCYPTGAGQTSRCVIRGIVFLLREYDRSSTTLSIP